MTYGRSGSTLLMGILNTIRGSRITGENLNTLFHIYRTIQVAGLVKKKFGRFKTEPTSAWYGADEINIKAFRTKLLDAFYADILGLTGLENIVGFKEINYGPDSFTDIDFDEFTEFVLQHIPNCTIIINTRNLDDTAKSAWHANTEDARAKLQSVEDRLLKLLQKHPEQTIHLHYDDYISDPAKLVESFATIGIELDIKKIERILKKKHSYKPGETKERPLAQKTSRLKKVLRAVSRRITT